MANWLRSGAVEMRFVKLSMQAVEAATDKRQKSAAGLEAFAEPEPEPPTSSSLSSEDTGLLPCLPVAPACCHACPVQHQTVEHLACGARQVRHGVTGRDVLQRLLRGTFVLSGNVNEQIRLMAV